MSSVLQFPVPEPKEQSCWDCRHYLSGTNTSLCLQFNEVIISERVSAKDCPAYDEIA